MLNYFIILLSLVSFTRAIPDPLAQETLNEELQSYPGFSLDLNAIRLVQMQEGDPIWMTEQEKIRAKAKGINFFDITETQGLWESASLSQNPPLPTPNATEIVKPILKTLSVINMLENLKKFTSFRTRYFLSDTGKESQEWLLQRIIEITEENASQSLRKLITAKEFKHWWSQSTIIVRIEGSNPGEATVIMGAHLDSKNNWPFLPAPGADDDGSGCVTILEAYRAIIASDFRPIRPMEFHFYSAEEGGLLGSQAVAKAYAVQSADVLAMFQFDMTAWVKSGTREEIGIVVDYTDNDVTNFNKALVDLYLDIPYVETKCGYACSDHASWTSTGYPSAFVTEGAALNANPNRHSSDDRIDISDEFSFSHMLEFSKLAVAFAVELGHFTSTK